MKRPLPNFVYCGAPKAASSSIWQALCSHPDIFFCPTKEPFFFDFNYEKGEDWYRNLFVGHKGQKIIGEATVWYMRWPSVPERMSKIIPEAKLLFVLRNPIDRYRSNYWHDVQSGYFFPESYTLDAAIEDLSDPRGLAMAGFYYAHLSRFLNHFPKHQIHITLFDDFKQSPEVEIRKIYEFLEISTDVVVPEMPQKMVTPGIRYCAFLKMVATADKTFSRFGFAQRFWNSHWRIRDMFFDKSKPLPPLTSEQRSKLGQIYSADVHSLSTYLNRDLNQWLDS